MRHRRIRSSTDSSSPPIWRLPALRATGSRGGRNQAGSPRRSPTGSTVSPCRGVDPSAETVASERAGHVSDRQVEVEHDSQVGVHKKNLPTGSPVWEESSAAGETQRGSGRTPSPCYMYIQEWKKQHVASRQCGHDVGCQPPLPAGRCPSRQRRADGFHFGTTIPGRQPAGDCSWPRSTFPIGEDVRF